MHLKIVKHRLRLLLRSKVKIVTGDNNINLFDSAKPQGGRRLVDINFEEAKITIYYTPGPVSAVTRGLGKARSFAKGPSFELSDPSCVEQLVRYLMAHYPDWIKGPNFAVRRSRKRKCS